MADMEFEGERSIESDEQHLWELISDPEVLVRCVPGAEDVERVSETHYTGVVVRSFAGLSVNLDGEVEMLERSPPDHMTMRAKGKDRVTKTEMDAEGTLDLRDGEGEATVLDYHMALEFTGKLPTHLLKGRITKDIDRFFDNIRSAAEDGLEDEESADDETEEEDEGGLLSRF